MIRDFGNIELCELLRRNPKRSAKYVYHNGTLASSIAHAGTSCVKEEGRIRNSFIQFSMDLLSIPEYVIKKGRPHGHRYGKKPGGQGILYGQPVEDEVQEEVLPGHP